MTKGHGNDLDRSAGGLSGFHLGGVLVRCFFFRIPELIFKGEKVSFREGKLNGGLGSGNPFPKMLNQFRVRARGYGIVFFPTLGILAHRN